MMKHLPQGAGPAQATQDTVDEQPDMPPSPGRKFPWTLTHSFYAVMGGFAFDNLSNKDDFPLPQGRTRLTLSTDGLMFLAEFEPTLVPDISETTIKDKSKSDGIAKVIAFWQALWFTAQFIMRLALGLNVSMLELNTILHVLCAVVAYFIFLWNKPLDIMEPTLITVDNRDTAVICAAMTVGSHVGVPPFKLAPEIVAQARKTWNFGFSSPISRRALTVAVLTALPHFPRDEIHLLHQVEALLQTRWSDISDDPRRERLHAATILSPPTLEPSELPQRLLVKYPRDWGSNATRPQDDSEEASVTIDADDVRRYYLAACGLSKYPVLMVDRPTDWVSVRAFSVSAAWGVALDPEDLETWVWTQSGVRLPDDQTWTTQRTKRQYIKAFLRSPTVSFAGFCLASLVYGGIHLLIGWNGPMNTKTEILLWRISSLALAAPVGYFPLAIISGLVLALVITLLALIYLALAGLLGLLGLDKMRGWLARLAKVIEKYYWTTVGFLLIPVVVGIFILFLLARGYIVVECFYSVLFAPSSVYDVPRWASYIFHF
jgi:hypothetical protein